MRKILPFLFISLCSCGQKSDSTKITASGVKVDSIHNANTTGSIEKKETAITDSAINAWKKHEDSLRNEILKSKEDKILKNSFLQEMYIRNVVRISNDSLFLTIPFDLHGPDCGAPDCYSTDISFNFKLGNTLIFPKNFQFQEYEHGCVDKERRLTGSFQLVEQTDKYVIYHSTKLKKTLVLFSSNKDNRTTAYYFAEVGQNRINGKNVYNITNGYNEEDKNSIYPFTSWVLTTNEYENFLQQ